MIETLCQIDPTCTGSRNKFGVEVVAQPVQRFPHSLRKTHQLAINVPLNHNMGTSLDLLDCLAQKTVAILQILIGKYAYRLNIQQ